MLGGGRLYAALYSGLYFCQGFPGFLVSGDVRVFLYGQVVRVSYVGSGVTRGFREDRSPQFSEPVRSVGSLGVVFLHVQFLVSYFLVGER